jgi:hypothetical protein
VTRNKHRAAFGGEFPAEGSRPTNAFGIEAIHGFIEQDDRWITEHCGGDAEPLTHTQRKLADTSSGDRGESNLIKDFINTRFGDAAVLGERTEVSVRRATGVKSACFEQPTHFAHRPAKILVLFPGDRDGTRIGMIEAHNHRHRRGLSRSVRTKESSYFPWCDVKREVVNGDDTTESFSQSADLNHSTTLSGSDDRSMQTA